MCKLIPQLALLFLTTVLLTCTGGGLQGVDPAEEHEVETDDGEQRHVDGDERAAYSKPQEVYDFVGIEKGDRVVDLLAGGGYNTLRVAERVGPHGKVIAERTRPQFQMEVEDGTIETAGNIEFIGWIGDLEEASVDVVLAIRAYHLFPDVPETLGMLNRALVPGGAFGVVETRLNQPEGHDMETHRMGEHTVIADMEGAGFEYVDSSAILRIDDDDYTIFVPEGRQRWRTDRMLMVFRKLE